MLPEKPGAYFKSPLVKLIITLLLFDVGLSQSTANNENNNSDNSVAFELPLLVTVPSTDGEHQLTVYRSVVNDKIMQEVASGNTQRVSQLQWVSVGNPVFVRVFQQSLNTTSQRYFQFTQYGFSGFIQMLTSDQKLLIAREASERYNINVTSRQIENMLLSTFECYMIFYDENDKRYLIKGHVGNFKTFPLRMYFDARRGTLERELAERILDNDSPDVLLRCHMSAGAKVVRTNLLNITGEKLQEIRLEDKLFGDSNGGRTEHVYVTRRQMSELAAEMYTSLNIIEEYEMPESEFNRAFVDEIIKQLSSEHFKQVPIDTALASLSTYTFDSRDDLRPDEIKSELSKILKIEEVDDKSRIVADRSRTSSNEASTDVNVEVSGKYSANIVSVAEVAAEASVKTGYSGAQKNSEDVKSLDDQLRELNRRTRDEIEWQFQGNKVIPKSLNVAKLSRSRFGQKLTFSRVRRQTSDAPFKSNFTMHITFDASSPVNQSTIHGMSFAASEIMNTMVANFGNVMDEMRSMRSQLDSWIAMKPKLEHAVNEIRSIRSHLEQWVAMKPKVEFVVNDIVRERQGVSVHRDVARTLTDGVHIYGLAVMNNELYVDRTDQSVIDVYDVSTLSRRRSLSKSGLRCVRDMASCPQCDVVYISGDCPPYKIHAINQRGEILFSWSLDQQPNGLSVNSQSNVVVTFPSSKTLRVYTSRGGLLRSIRLQSDITYPTQAVQLSHDRFAVVHHGDLDRVCIVNSQGNITESYGGRHGSGVGQLHEPYRMLIINGSMIVADWNNYRLVLFNLSPLTYTREVISTRLKEMKPQRLALSTDGSRMFVAYASHIHTFNVMLT